ncbi:hypothetical protein WICPIJ_009016 [Wickerhamomyces pijperi]|uniref:Uncharacterized protein n=1 Tax=Wickerhamomyces pijperi TaxID=599730 RepID=A0A9P8PTZ2_WICPI|nr:hypothetical protein WICPIJ_009016 [Wickerhamomyces pijperi]
MKDPMKSPTTEVIKVMRRVNSSQLPFPQILPPLTDELSILKFKPFKESFKSFSTLEFRPADILPPVKLADKTPGIPEDCFSLRWNCSSLTHPFGKKVGYEMQQRSSVGHQMGYLGIVGLTGDAVAYSAVVVAVVVIAAAVEAFAPYLKV